MKKTLSILLAAALMSVLAVPAFAADDVAENGNSTDSKEVTATYDKLVDDKNVDTVYLVNVDWTVESTLKYSEGTKVYTWNASETKYDAETNGEGWIGDAAVDITVTNKSNADMTATASWTKANGIEAACTFENDSSIDIESAAKDVEIADGETGSPKTGKINAKVGTPSSGTIATNNAPVGTITVSIAPKSNS